MELTAYEILGYAASLLVAISLLMRSVLRLRIINMIGAIVFTIYGLLIQAYPVAVMNFAIVLINLYYLYGMVRRHDYFELLEVSPESKYLEYFMNFYREDIAHFQPDYEYTPNPALRVYLVLRNMIPVCVFVARQDGEDGLHVQLDYVIPGYRDLKPAHFLYGERATIFTEQGIRRLSTLPGGPAHERYLQRVGFHRDPDRATHYIKLLA